VPTTDRFNVNKPALPHHVKSTQFDCGSKQSFPDTAEEHYSIVYFEALDLIISHVSDRFDKHDYKSYS